MFSQMNTHISIFIEILQTCLFLKDKDRRQRQNAVNEQFCVIMITSKLWMMLVKDLIYLFSCAAKFVDIHFFLHHNQASPKLIINLTCWKVKTFSEMQ